MAPSLKSVILSASKIEDLNTMIDEWLEHSDIQIDHIRTSLTMIKGEYVVLIIYRPDMIIAEPEVNNNVGSPKGKKNLLP